jgi:riboflavin synthase
MTLESFNDASYVFFAMSESLNKTNFWEKKQWDYFNVERCMRVWDRIDGHFVSGHTDCVWKLISITELPDNSNILQVEFLGDFANNLVEKGSVCINGVSLTVIEKWLRFFTVSIIPHTWNVTNLGDLKEWDSVNLEFDMLWKYILNTKNNV